MLPIVMMTFHMKSLIIYVADSNDDISYKIIYVADSNDDMPEPVSPTPWTLGKVVTSITWWSVIAHVGDIVIVVIAVVIAFVHVNVIVIVIIIVIVIVVKNEPFLYCGLSGLMQTPQLGTWCQSSIKSNTTNNHSIKSLIMLSLVVIGIHLGSKQFFVPPA